MAKEGLDWINSSQKRKMDKFFSAMGLPLVGLGSGLISLYMAHEGYPRESGVVTQARAGKNGREFQMEKFRTTHPLTGETLGAWADAIRRYGVDELAQLRQVWDGTMSLCGRRPWVPEEHELIMDTLGSHLKATAERVVRDSPVGVVSTWGNFVHSHESVLSTDPNRYDEMIGMCAFDLDHASFRHDVGLVRDLAGLILHKGMKD